MKSIKLKILNQLVSEKRDINVYLHSNRSAFILSYNNSISLPLSINDKGDYLHISIVSGPGNLEKDCIINLPIIADFKFFSQGNFSIIHTQGRTLLEIPPGPPLWQLKIKYTLEISKSIKNTSDYITIGDSM